MINIGDFYKALTKNQFNFFTGVPDSYLKSFCAYIQDNVPTEKHIIAANEGNAIGIASGFHLATGATGVVYMQNSGLGNAINPLLSLVDDKVYNIPVLLIVGWRGEPEKKDEPQHITQGELTIPLIETLNIKYAIIDKDFENQVKQAKEHIDKTNTPFVLIIRNKTFSEYNLKTCIDNTQYSLSRERALEIILSNLNRDDLVVSTTGKTSREIFEIRENLNQGHNNDFLMVGAMGHTSSVALGLALNTNKNVYCIDGDGSYIMHMGSNTINANVSPKTFKYIVINNGCHESVGKQPTVGFSFDMAKSLKAQAFNNVYEVKTAEELTTSLEKMANSTKTALVIYTNSDSRTNLGRPTISTHENKKNFMSKVKEV